MQRMPLALTAFALAVSAAAVEAQTLKIGYINSQEILANAPGALAAGQQFDEEMQAYQTQITALEEELNGMQQRLQQQQLTLSPEAKANREAQLQQKLNEYQQTTANLQQVADQRRAELIQPVMDDITEVIEALRAEGGYTFILDVAAGSIISADPTLDLTQTVIDRLQAAAPEGDR